MGEDGKHARALPGCQAIDAGDRPAGDGRLHQHRVAHAREGNIAGIDRPARNFVCAIDAGARAPYLLLLRDRLVLLILLRLDHRILGCRMRNDPGRR